MKSNFELIEYILKNIFSGRWKENQKIPSKRFFSIKFNLTTNVVAKTLDKLVVSNTIYSVLKFGYFVSKKNTNFLNKFEKNADQCTHAKIDFINLFNDETNFFKAEIKDQKGYFYIKKYLDDNNFVHKISISWNHECIIKDKELLETSLFECFVKSDVIPLSKKIIESWSKNSHEILKEEIMQSNFGYLTKKVILLDKNNNPIHVAFIYINPMSWKREQFLSLGKYD